MATILVVLVIVLSILFVGAVLFIGAAFNGYRHLIDQVEELREDLRLEQHFHECTRIHETDLERELAAYHDRAFTEGLAQVARQQHEWEAEGIANTARLFAGIDDENNIPAFGLPQVCVDDGFNPFRTSDLEMEMELLARAESNAAVDLDEDAWEKGSKEFRPVSLVGPTMSDDACLHSRMNWKQAPKAKAPTPGTEEHLYSVVEPYGDYEQMVVQQADDDSHWYDECYVSVETIYIWSTEHRIWVIYHDRYQACNDRESLMTYDEYYNAQIR